MSWSQPVFADIAGLVGARAGLSFANRQDSAELGIRRAMVRAGWAEPGPYLDRLAGDRKLLDDLVSELTVGETYFFREPGHFELIRREVVPEVRGRRGPEHVIRAWSAGCASGEEAFSLAILFEEAGLGDRLHLLATDISHQALDKARRATYGDWSLRGERGKAALPYLLPRSQAKRETGYQLVESIQKRVSFASLNLALDVYPSFANGTWGMDLILCRNVLIYFDAETVRRVAQRLYDALADGGWLITASSDPPLWEAAPFQVVARGEGLFYRRVASESRERGSGVRTEGLGISDQESLCAEYAGESSRRASGSLASAAGRCEGAEAEPPLRGAASEPLALRQNGAVDVLDEARQSLARGEYARVVQLTENQPGPAAALLHIRALANLDATAASDSCARAAAAEPLSADLHYLHAVLLLDQGRSDEAAAALRRVIYLDRTLAMAHFTLGSVLRGRGDRAGACRAFRNARDLCAGRPAHEIVPLADGEQAGRLAEAAAAQLTFIEGGS